MKMTFLKYFLLIPVFVLWAGHSVLAFGQRPEQASAGVSTDQDGDTNNDGIADSATPSGTFNGTASGIFTAESSNAVRGVASTATDADFSPIETNDVFVGSGNNPTIQTVGNRAPGTVRERGLSTQPASSVNNPGFSGTQSTSGLFSGTATGTGASGGAGASAGASGGTT